MNSKDLEFHRETGRLALDWIATLGERHADVIERVDSLDAFTAWLTDVAGYDAVCAPTKQDFEDALKLRAAIIGFLEALHAKDDPAAQDIDTVNTYAAIPQRELRLAKSGREIEPNAAPSMRFLLGEIARDAVNLATGDDLAKMKLCEADDCSVYFVDYSRPGKRRWCSMSRCGNKAKKTRFNARKA